MKFLSILTLSAILSILLRSEAAAEIFTFSCYTNMYYVEEEDDYIGYNVIVVPTESRIKVLVQEGSGALLVPQLVEGTKNKNGVLTFEMVVDNFEKTKWTGEVRDDEVIMTADGLASQKLSRICRTH